MKKIILSLTLCAMASIAMASTNEITAKAYLKVNKNYTEITRDSGTMLIQMSGQRYNSQVVIATNGWREVSKGSVVSMGWSVFSNLSTNQNTYISLDTGVTTNMMLKPGEMSLLRFHPAQQITNIVIRTTNSTADTEFTIVED